jgi:hypothetical protein
MKGWRLPVGAFGILLLLATGTPAGEALETLSWEGRPLTIQRDPLTGTPVVIRGLREPLLTLKNGYPRDRSAAAAAGLLLVRQLGPLLPVGAKQLRFKSAEEIEGSWFVSFWQIETNYIVYGSSFGYSIDAGGNIQSLGAVLYPGITVPEKFRISREQALRTARGRIENFRKFHYRLVAENVIIAPDRRTRPITYRRVYAFNFFPPEKYRHPATPEAGVGFFIDTQTGKVVDRQTLFKPLGCCVPESGGPINVEEEYTFQIGK